MLNAFFQILFYAVFFASAILLILVILLQESKGGGLSEAFGGAGAETFGPRAGGISRFTFGLFAAWILSAMALHWSAGKGGGGSQFDGLGGPPAEAVAPASEQAEQPASPEQPR